MSRGNVRFRNRFMSRYRWVGAAVLGLGTAATIVTTEVASAEREFAAGIHLVGTPLGHTGGFGEPSCIACHLEFEINPEGGILNAAGFPTSFEPGHTYELTIGLKGEGMLKGGFQASVRFTDGTQGGQLRAHDARVIVSDSSDVQYAGHAQGAVEVTGPDEISWTLQWIAPNERRDVTLHVAANSANGDNSPLGDWVFATARHSNPRGDGRP